MRVFRADVATAVAARACDYCGSAIAPHCEYNRVAAYDGSRAGIARTHLACGATQVRMAAYRAAPAGGAEAEDSDVVAFFAGLGVDSDRFAAAAAAPTAGRSTTKPGDALDLIQSFGGLMEMAAAIRRDHKAIQSWLRSHHVGAESITRIRVELRRLGIAMTPDEIRWLFDQSREKWRRAQCGL